MTHTPGPWVIHNDDTDEAYWTIRNPSPEAIESEPLFADYRGVLIAKLPYIESRMDSLQRANNNARLIAAAPQLLDALEAHQDFIRAYFAIIEYEELQIAKSLGFDEMNKKTEQALADAKGGE